MKTKTYSTWKFEELPEDTQEKVLDHYRDINVDNSSWYDYDGKTGFTAKELKRMKIKDIYASNVNELLKYKTLYFDLYRSWYIQFVDADFVDDEIARKFLRVPADIWNRTCWNIVSGRGELNTRLEYDWQGEKDLTKRQEEILERAVELFSDKMEEALKGLRDSYEYLATDEAVKETLLCNDYDFDENGQIA